MSDELKPFIPWIIRAKEGIVLLAEEYGWKVNRSINVKPNTRLEFDIIKNDDAVFEIIWGIDSAPRWMDDWAVLSSTVRNVHSGELIRPPADLWGTVIKSKGVWTLEEHLRWKMTGIREDWIPTQEELLAKKPGFTRLLVDPKAY